MTRNEVAGEMLKNMVDEWHEAANNMPEGNEPPFAGLRETLKRPKFKLGNAKTKNGDKAVILEIGEQMFGRLCVRAMEGWKWIPYAWNRNGETGSIGNTENDLESNVEPRRVVVEMIFSRAMAEQMGVGEELIGLRTRVIALELVD